MKENEDFVDEVKNHYETKESPMPSKNSCKGLPVEDGVIKCPVCGFKAKSERGLKKHTTMSHTQKTTTR